MRRKIGQRIVVLIGDWGATREETMHAFADEIIAASKRRRLRLDEVVFEGTFRDKEYADEDVLAVHDQ